VNLAVVAEQADATVSKSRRCQTKQAFVRPIRALSDSTVGLSSLFQVLPNRFGASRLLANLLATNARLKSPAPRPSGVANIKKCWSVSAVAVVQDLNR
jgi:hypothetical protein